MASGFPVVRLEGAPEQRGRQYGSKCRQLILRSLHYYEEVLFPTMGVWPTQVKAIAERAEEAIARFSKSASAELYGIADGAGVEPWRLFALNARTEIVNSSELPIVGECTTILFRKPLLMGQNWDWTREAMDHSVILDIRDPSGRREIILTEAGMLGKLGLNSFGLGLCINILGNKHSTIGVPIHVLTREVLMACDVAEARSIVERAGVGRSSHILIADRSGGIASFEFAGDETFEVAVPQETFLHTNHCIAGEACASPSQGSSTMSRWRRATALMERSTDADMESLLGLLSDQGGGAGSLNVSWMPSVTMQGIVVGTCSTIAIDLPGRSISIWMGPGAISRGERAQQFELSRSD